MVIDTPKVQVGYEEILRLIIMSLEKGLKHLQSKVKPLNEMLKKRGFKTVLEFSGRKGYHVFVFFENPVPAKEAHVTGKYFADKIQKGLEVFPKQTTLRGLKLGSQIKLPLSWHKESGERSQLVDDDFKPLPQQYSSLMNAPYTEYSVLAEKLEELVR